MTGAILAGGRATRLGGVNKATLPLGAEPGVTPLARILDVFAGRFDGAVIVAAPGMAFEGWAPSGAPLSVVSDRFPGCGPLGGLHAALSAVRTPFAFVCGGDMPSLCGALLDLMADRSVAGRCLVPVRAGRPEPLHAIYPACLRDEAERALGEGVRMMLDFLARVPVDYLSEEDYLPIEGASRSFDNINTAEDLERVRETLRA